MRKLEIKYFYPGEAFKDGTEVFVITQITDQGVFALGAVVFDPKTMVEAICLEQEQRIIKRRKRELG